MDFNNICLVLVEPRGSRNIGSVCRAMKNFGFCDLRLVRPQADYLNDEARHMAVKSAELLEGARHYPSLGAAVADCRLIFGTTRRFGKYRNEFLYPSGAAKRIAESGDDAVALVFGPEDSGLTAGDLELCQRLITIPTSDRLPSMNISQAVCLCLYEVAKEIGADHQEQDPAPPELALSRECEAMYDHMRETLLAIGYLNPQNPDHIMRSFRRLFGRQGLTMREVRILRGMLSKIDRLAAMADGTGLKGKPPQPGRD